jgi:ATP-dependent Clp protease ATP-binding subunit ClpC
MFDRYTDEARRVIFFARYEASLLGSPTLETEHFWLGLLRECKKVVKRLAPNVTAEGVHERLARHGPRAERTSMAVDMPLSEKAIRALAAATAEADGRGQKHITPDYIVLALLREEQPGV